MARSHVHEFLMRFRFTMILEGQEGPTALTRCVSDPFTDSLFISRGYRASYAHSAHSNASANDADLHTLLALYRNAWEHSPKKAFRGEVIMTRGSGAIGKRVRFSFTGFEVKPFDLDAEDEEVALETVRLTGVRYWPGENE